jgi:hypothetical protein
LVDEVDACPQNIKRLLLARVPGLVLLDRVKRVLGENDRAVAVGLKVYANVEYLTPVGVQSTLSFRVCST